MLNLASSAVFCFYHYLKEGACSRYLAGVINLFAINAKHFRTWPLVRRGQVTKVH